MFMLRHLSPTRPLFLHLLSFQRSAPSLSDPSEEGLATQRPTQRARERESIKTSRLSVSRSAQKAEHGGTAAIPLLISSIDCLNGCHWRWRDRQAAFVRTTEQSCDAALSPIHYWCEAEGYTSSTYGDGKLWNRDDTIPEI